MTLASDTPPRISVVICAFSDERFDDLCRAIRSLRGQTVAPDELVVAIDRNPALLRRASELPDVVAVANTAHPGAGGARNSGVAASTGELIAFVDDDVVATPDWLERLIAGFRDPLIVGVGGRIDPIWATQRPPWFPEEFDWVIGCSYRGLPSAPTRVRNVISANMAVRRSAFDAVGGFQPNFGKRGQRSEPEETELCLRVTRAFPNSRWLYLPEARVGHRVTPQREQIRYFLARCVNEGCGKARMTALGHTHESLDTERAYVRDVLPRGFLRGFGRGLPGVASSAMIAVGFTVTAITYVLESTRIAASRWITGRLPGSRGTAYPPGAPLR